MAEEARLCAKHGVRLIRDNGPHERLFILEVMVELRRACAGRLTNVLDRCAGYTALLDKTRRRGNDPISRCLAFRREFGVSPSPKSHRVSLAYFGVDNPFFGLYIGLTTPNSRIMIEMNRDQDLTGSTALVTGATSGIGRAAALALARRGARVLISGRDAERGRAVVAAIQRDGG